MPKKFLKACHTYAAIPANSTRKIKWDIVNGNLTEKLKRMNFFSPVRSK